VAKVDRGCSPFRYSELSALSRRWKTDLPTDTWRSWGTMTSSGPQRSSFPTSTANESELMSHQDRRAVVGSVGARPIDFRRSPSPTRRLRSAVDYRRDVLERQRHLQVLESNRTLRKFMRVLQQEEEAKATAALFSTPSSAICRQRPRTISSVVDKEPRPVTSPRAATGNPRCRENKPASSTTRCCSSTVRRNADDGFHLRLDKQRQRGGKSQSSSRRDIEEDWAIDCAFRPSQVLPADRPLRGRRR